MIEGGHYLLPLHTVKHPTLSVTSSGKHQEGPDDWEGAMDL